MFKLLNDAFNCNVNQGQIWKILKNSVFLLFYGHVIASSSKPVIKSSVTMVTSEIASKRDIVKMRSLSIVAFLSSWLFERPDSEIKLFIGNTDKRQSFTRTFDQALVPSPNKRRVNTTGKSSGSSAEENSESGRAFQCLFGLADEVVLVNFSSSKERVWSLQCLIWMIMSFAGKLAPSDLYKAVSVYCVSSRLIRDPYFENASFMDAVSRDKSSCHFLYLLNVYLWGHSGWA